MKTNLIWNDGKTQSAGKLVKVLAECPLWPDANRSTELREVPQVLAVAVPFGTTGYKAYNMRADGKMVKNGKCKIWESLAAIQQHFAAL